MSATKNPTDDELLAAWREERCTLGYEPCPSAEEPDADLVRQVLDVPNVDAAAYESAVLGLADGDDDAMKLARALRRRFPQPITDAVLRAEGFEPDEDTKPYWRLVVCERADSDGQILAFCNPAVLHLAWYEGTEWIDGINVRTPDRLHEVVEHLKGLYAPGEELDMKSIDPEHLSDAMLLAGLVLYEVVASWAVLRFVWWYTAGGTQ